MSTRVVDTDGRGGVSISLLIDDTGEVYHVNGNIGQVKFNLSSSNSTSYRHNSMMNEA